MYGIVTGKEMEELKECIRDASKNRDLEKLKSCTVEAEGITYSADPGIPTFESNIFEQGNGRGKEKYDMDIELMDVDKYIDSQLGRFRKRDLKGMTPREAYEWGLNEEKIDEMAEEMEEGEAFPMPVVAYDREGKLEMFQEGRHRGEAVDELGKEKILTWVARRCEKRGCGDNEF